MEFKLSKNTRLLKIYFYLTSILFFSSCSLIPCNFDSGLDELKKKQKDIFFIGEYVIEKNKNYKHETENSQIVVNKNGSINIENIPSSVFYLSKPNENLNIKGKWELIFKDKTQYLSLNLKIKGKNLLTSWKMYKKKGKPVILIRVGDPDSCSAVRFIKE